MSDFRPANDAGRHERRVLFEGLGVSVLDFRCRAHVEPDGAEEPNPTHSIVLVRRGVFGRKRERETLLADANHVLFFNAGEPYRYWHPLPGGDDCTILAVDGPRALELVARHAPRDAEDPERPFRPSHGLGSSRVAGLHYELLALVGGTCPPLAAEDVLAELAGECVAAAYGDGTEAGSPGGASAAGRRRRRDLVEATKLAINRRLESLPGLGELARAVDCSPFHLSRTFRRVTGVSLRRYAGRLRSRLAAERLAAGAPDLTGLALELGYADHSHFTNTFRREWGVAPSRFRARAARG